jgi:hypothetical protein
VRWVFDSCNSCWFWVFKNKIKSESKNHGFGVLDNIQNQRTTGSGFFKKFKGLSGFMKEPAKAFSVVI